MKKYIFIILAIVAVVAIGGYYFLFGKKDVCKNVIPEDAKAVMVLDSKQLVKQIGIDSSDILGFLQSDKNKKEDLGIDLLSPIYGFLSNESYLCGVMALSDADDFEEAIKKEGISVESQRGFKWAYNKEMIVCYDDEKALLLGPISQTESHNMRPRMVEWMSQSSSKNPMLSSVLKQDGALCLSSKMSVVPGSYMHQVLQYLNNPFDMDKVFLNAELSIKEKSLHLSASVESDEEEIKDLVSKADGILQPIQASQLRSSASDPLLWVGFNAKGASLLEGMRKNSVLRLFLVGVNLCVDADMMLKAVDGDVCFELSDITSQQANYTLKAQVTNQDFLKNANEWNTGFLGKSFSFKSIDKNNYMLQGAGSTTYFGVKDNIAYFSSNQNVTSNEGSNTSDNFVSNNKSEIEGKIIYASISMNKLSRLPEIQNMMGKDSQMLNVFFDKMDRFTVSATDYLHYDIELTTKEDISDFIKQFLK
ncbi:MAG: DUF4836 family protein [Bacteroidaceae bacterium]|nr:DUF4836 family protein [Bacteroidaceae bacterium]